LHAPPLLRTLIVGLALAVLAGTVAGSHPGSRNEPRPPTADRTDRRNEPTTTPDHVARGQARPSAAATSCTRQDWGLPVPPRAAPMTTIASPAAVSRAG